MAYKPKTGDTVTADGWNTGTKFSGVFMKHLDDERSEIRDPVTKWKITVIRSSIKSLR